MKFSMPISSDVQIFSFLFCFTKKFNFYLDTADKSIYIYTQASTLRIARYCNPELFVVHINFFAISKRPKSFSDVTYRFAINFKISPSFLVLASSFSNVMQPKVSNKDFIANFSAFSPHRKMFIDAGYGFEINLKIYTACSGFKRC